MLENFNENKKQCAINFAKGEKTRNISIHLQHKI